MRRPDLLRSLAVGAVVVGALLTVSLGVSALLGPGATPASAREVPAWGQQDTLGNGTVELNLLGGNDSISPDLVYQGAYDTTNTTFPVLLTGNATTGFWSSDQSVLVMAPAIPSYEYSHDAGMIEFAAGNGSSWDIGTVAVSSPPDTGDGVTTYFMLDPVDNTSWNSDFYMINPEGPYVSTPVCSGAVIFPYSYTPYVAVQWDPAYVTAYCGTGTVGAYNVYLVVPGPNGTVNGADIQYLGPLGRDYGPAPPADSWFATSVRYNSTVNAVNATVVDEDDPSVAYDLDANLSAYNFTPAAGSGPYVSAVLEGGYNAGGSGLLYASEFPEASWEFPTSNATGASGVSLAVYAVAGGGAAAVAVAGVLAWRSRTVKPPSLRA